MQLLRAQRAERLLVGDAGGTAGTVTEEEEEEQRLCIHTPFLRSRERF